MNVHNKLTHDQLKAMRKRISAKHSIGLNGSILNPHDDVFNQEVFSFLALMEYYRGGTIVEIGTKRGVSAMVFAHYAPKVITFDIAPLIDEARTIWDQFGVSDKIESRIVTGDVADISGIDAKFAFVDGNHTEAAVKRDFAAVKHVGTVLFHDYIEPKCKGVVKAVDSITDGVVLRKPPFALWTAAGE